jgi:predicted TIM-barrel fold metal-dependent hydrolase
MMDAYTHLDLTCADPIADMKARMEYAGINRALVVETWKGDNFPWLQKMMAELPTQFRIVPCFRPGQKQPSAAILHNAAVMGLRVKTADLRLLQNLEPSFAASGKWLVPHAENGIGPLKEELLAHAQRAPGLQIYLPHLGWPRQNRIDDGEWEAAVSELHAIPGMVVGISALDHFSREPFPHKDVEPFAACLIEIFGPASVVAASDYPLVEKDRYTECMQLAATWIRRADAHWSPRFEQAWINGVEGEKSL